MTDAHAAPRGVGVVVVAAGSGARLGAGVPKAF
ncbi:2-C-methyl-D-erythritol 4-phosphate cytidylyltransferase, partial [Phycicoccus sp. CMS6Z-2]|nr:2-C-methyl-D-erythritol 4-phosphate cytidylyltransferase [Phycicoccus flavus]